MVKIFYYYKIWSIKSSNVYSSGITDSAKTYYFCRDDETSGVNINGNFTIQNDRAELTNGYYAVSNFTIHGDVSLYTDGIINCDNKMDANINVTGNWANSGSFIAGSNTVTLTGGNQSITGLTTFNNLVKKITSASSLTFTTGSSNKTTISGTMNFSGIEGQLLSLNSSSPGSQFEIDPQGSRIIAYLDIRDSYNINLITINAEASNNNFFDY